MQATVVLASTSTYRCELLSRLGIPFSVESPAVDETALPDEGPGTLARRLAAAKATRVLERLKTGANSQRIGAQLTVIGSDQVAACDQQCLGKPGTVTAARAQLTAMSGQCVEFHTGVTLLTYQTAGNRLITYNHLDITRAHLRKLTTDEIERYVEADNPLDCAGSFKVESLGIALFERVETDDPTALTGLPLIAVARALREAGISIP